MKSTRAEEPRMIVIACVPDFEKKRRKMVMVHKLFFLDFFSPYKIIS